MALNPLNPSGTVNLNDLARLTLVASDASYGGTSLAVGAPLAPFPDSQGPEIPCLFEEEARGSGYRVVERFQHGPTGFKAVIFRNVTTNDVVVAFAGSDGTNLKDWWGNAFHYGWNQWTENRQDVFSFLAGLQDPDSATPFTGRIHFTGQSLGGALAQYAAFEFVRNNQTFNKQNLTLTTFNALGAVATLNENLGTGFDHDLLMGMGSIAHYRTPNDFVSRLGEGHLGGDAVYQLPFRPGGTNPVTNRPYEFDLVTTHRIESGFYANLREEDGWFSNALRKLPEAGYLLVPNLQRAASFLGNPLKSEAVSSPEALIRLSSGVMFAAILAPSAETNRLVWSIGQAQFDAGAMSKEQAESVGRVDWGRTAKLWSLAITVASPLALVTTWVGSVILGRLASGFGFATSDAVRAVQEQFGPAVTVKEPAEVPLSQSEARFDVLMARLEAEPGSALASVDAEGLAEQLASGEGWEEASLEYVQQTTGTSATESVALDARFGALMYDAALAATSDDGTYAEGLFEVLRAHFEEAGRKVANSRTDLTLKYANVDPGVFGTTTDFVAYDAIHDALEQAGSDPANALIKDLIDEELQIVESAGQTVVLSTGRSQNPFGGPAYDPDIAVLPEEDVEEGGLKRFTLSLPYEAHEGGQRIAIALEGTAASNIKLLANGEDIAAQDGIYVVTVEEGKRELELAVWAQVDAVEDGELSLSATLVDAAGQATHLTHLEANVSFSARDERIFDGAPDLAGDNSQFALIQGGVTGQRGLYVDFQGGDDIIWADAAEDRLMGGAGNDRLYGSFRTYFNAHDRDWLSGGSGDDWLLGHEGDDILEGDSGADLLLGDLGDDFLFGNSKTDYATIFTTGGGDGEGDLLQGGAGQDLVVGSAGGDDISGGNDADLILGGAGSDEIRGDTEFTPTHSFLIHGVTFPPEQPLAAGADVIYGNAGSDLVFGEGANDLLYGGEGGDTLTGGDGSDELYGGTGNDILIADSDSVGSGQGNDYLDGGEGDDELRGESGSDTLIGSKGSDKLDGGEGGDSYAFSAGDGKDTIVEQGVSGVDVLVLDDHARSDITIAQLVNGSIRLMGANGDAITIAGASLGPFGIDRLQFADGTALSGGELIAASVIDEETEINGPAWERFSDADDIIFTTQLPGEDNDIVLVDAGLGDDTVHGGSTAVVFGNEGNDVLIGGRTLLGGEGNDFLSDASRLYGGAGDDELRGGDILAGGAGNDSLDGGAGANRYQFKLGETGTDLVADTHGGLSLEELAEWYYPSIGIADWRSMLGEAETEERLTLEDAIAAGRLPPLPVIAGNDYAALEPLYATGAIEMDTVELPDGLELEDILAEVDETDTTLTLAWGDGQAIQVTLAVADDPIGTGVELFQFAGGATMTLVEVLAWADPPALPPILGTEEDDFLNGTPDSERIIGLGGDDFLNGGAGEDKLEGNEGSDFLNGDEGNDVLSGDAGTDGLNGNDGNDTLSGGPGDDFAVGGTGDDVYMFGAGDGVDFVSDEEGADAIGFGAGITPHGVGITKDPYGTLYLVYGSGNRVGMEWLDGEAPQIETVHFDDETVWDAAEIESRVATLLATEFSDVLNQGDASDIVNGLGGNDEIYGLAGDDVLAGDTGDDYLEGNAGNDILRGSAGADGAADWQGNNLLDGGAGDDNILADGIPHDPDGGSNFVVGGTGDDWIDSHASGNVIAFNAGDGHDTVYAANTLTLSLGGGIAPSNLALSQDGAELVLSLGTDDSIRLTRQFEVDPQAWPQITLQMFGSVHFYDFNAVIAEFQAALAADPLLAGFSLEAVLPAYETGVSETEAHGGALAYQYGTAGNLNGIGDAAIGEVLGDENFGSGLQSIEIPGGNQAPVVAIAPQDQEAQEDALFAFTLPAETFTDADADDVLVYSASLADDSPPSSWLVFDAGSRTFSGTPANGDVGAIAVKVTATDPTGASASGTFNITVTNTNDAPMIDVPIANQSATVGVPFNLALPGNVFVDIDQGEILVYGATLASAEPLPDWLVFNPGASTFSGTPDAGDMGILSVRVTATDLAGEVAIDEFEILVSGNAQGVHLMGTAANDELTATEHDDVLEGLEGRDMLMGLGGEDELFGGRGRDHLLGGDGGDMLFGGRARDTLVGGPGDDLLAGGRGDDRLEAGMGDDTYVHEQYGGHDVIAETSGTDSLLFGEGITPGMARLRRQHNDLVVDLSGSHGSITIKGWFTASSAKKVEIIRFDDGTTWNTEEIRDRANGHDAWWHGDDPAYRHGDRSDSYHGKAHSPRGDSGDDSSRRKRDPIAEYLAAYLADKPRYDFDVLTQELASDRRKGEVLSVEEIARRWQKVARFGAGLANEQDGNAPGAGHRMVFGMSADLTLVSGLGHASRSGTMSDGADLRTFRGLEEGFSHLRS